MTSFCCFAAKWIELPPCSRADVMNALLRGPAVSAAPTPAASSDAKEEADSDDEPEVEVVSACTCSSLHPLKSNAKTFALSLSGKERVSQCVAWLLQRLAEPTRSDQGDAIKKRLKQRNLMFEFLGTSVAGTSEHSDQVLSALKSFTGASRCDAAQWLVKGLGDQQVCFVVASSDSGCFRTLLTWPRELR